MRGEGKVGEFDFQTNTTLNFMMGQRFGLSRFTFRLQLSDWAIQSDGDTVAKAQEFGEAVALPPAHLLNKHNHQVCHHLSVFQRN